jgi:hypothetical protein
MQTVFKHYHRQTAFNFKKERGRVPGMEGALMKFTQICPILPGWFAIYDGADEAADREIVALALTDKGEIAPLVLDLEETEFVDAVSIPGFSGLAYEDPEEESDEEEEQERPPRKVGDVADLAAEYIRKRDQERDEEP